MDTFITAENKFEALAVDAIVESRMRFKTIGRFSK
jgi:hypothetical protein